MNRKFKAVPGKGIVASTILSSTDALSGSVINDRLVNKCYWSDNSAWGLFDDDETYTLKETMSILARECRSSGEFDDYDYAGKWGRECARAIFDDREPNYNL